MTLKLGDLPIEFDGKFIESVKAELVDNLQEDVFNKVYKSINIKDIQNHIYQELDKEIQTELCRFYQPLDDYGEPKGDKINLRQFMKDFIKDYWTERVNKEGKHVSKKDTWAYKEGTPRYVYIMHEFLGNEFRSELAKIINQFIQQFRHNFSKAFLELVQFQINTQWRKTESYKEPIKSDCE